MSEPKRFVYILKSISDPTQHCVGVTSNVFARLCAHNAGLSAHTAEHRPWKALVVIEFDEEEPARRFEKYLKTGSGLEFSRRHFRQTGATRRRPFPNPRNDGAVPSSDSESAPRV